jgi:HIRAN domain
MQMRAQIRGASFFGRRALEHSRDLQYGEPLILMREPTNKADRNAIKVLEILGKPIGYVAREVAADVAPRMDRGEFWLADVLRASYTTFRAGRPRMTYPVVLLRRTRERIRTIVDEPSDHAWKDWVDRDSY